MQNSIFSTIIKIATALLLCAVMTTHSAWADLTSSINNLIQKNLSKAHVGVVILDGVTGKTLYNYNGNLPFTPASTTKLFPGAAALFALGPEYRYQTTVSVNPQQWQEQGQIVNGNLYVKFNGDPSLTLFDVKQLIQQTKQAGITTINGDVIVDSSLFAEPLYAPGWTQDSLAWDYSAPVSAIIINANAIPLQIIPGNKIGDKVLIKELDGKNYIDVVSNAITTTYSDALSCPLTPRIEGQTQISFNGCWPIKQPTALSIAINNPDIYAQRIIAQALNDHGIQLKGKVRNGTSPATDTLKIIATKTSEPLSTLLKHMLKKSDNLYAETLSKTMGSVYYSKGSFRTGVMAYKAILNQRLKIDFDDTELWDGSGQSRYNLITPFHLARLLYGMSKTPKLGEVFQESLSISGKDGTLRFRMGNDGLLGRIHGKTGALKGISALAGYVYANNNHPYVFAIMVNQIIGKNYSAKTVQNEICKMLFSNKV